MQALPFARGTNSFSLPFLLSLHMQWNAKVTFFALKSSPAVYFRFLYMDGRQLVGDLRAGLLQLTVEQVGAHTFLCMLSASIIPFVNLMRAC